MKSIKVKIRAYKTTDYPNVEKNMLEANVFHPPWDSKKNFNKKIKIDPNSILVAIVDNKVVGSILLMTDGWAAFLYRLAVHKDFRGKGVGSSLLLAAEKEVKKRGIKQAGLFMDDEDKILLRFYKKRGYEPIVKRLLMIKPL